MDVQEWDDTMHHSHSRRKCHPRYGKKQTSSMPISSKRRCRSEREGGDGKERHDVVVKEEGERELLSDSHHGEEVPQAGEHSQEREREVGKRRKNMEDRRTD